MVGGDTSSDVIHTALSPFAEKKIWVRCWPGHGIVVDLIVHELMSTPSPATRFVGQAAQVIFVSGITLNHGIRSVDTRA